MGACYGEYWEGEARLIYICDSFRLVNGRLIIHVLTDARDSVVLQQYGRLQLIRKYEFAKNIWMDCSLDRNHPLARLIFEKARKYGQRKVGDDGKAHLCAVRQPDSKRSIRKMREPMRSGSFTAACGHAKKREAPSITGRKAVPTNTAGHVFSGGEREGIWKKRV